MTAITLDNENGSYRIEVPYDQMTLDDVVKQVIVPVLLAAGYQYESVSEVFNGESC